MAINFPNAPTIGQAFQGFIYDGTAWVSSPSSVTGALPAGTIVAWGSTTAPANWLICDGAAVSRTTYASLFAVIGTQFGAGNGTTTFNVPDLRGRVAVGREAETSLGTATVTIASPGVVTTAAHGLSDGQVVYLTTTGALPTGITPNTRYFVRDVTATTFRLASTLGGAAINTSGTQSGTHTAWSADFADIGASYGKKNHTLTTSEIPSHNHTAAQSGQTFTPAGAGGYVASASGGTGQGLNSSQWGVVVNNTGGGMAHLNLQPYEIVNYIIKFSNGDTPGDSQLTQRVSSLEARPATALVPILPTSVVKTGGTVSQTSLGQVAFNAVTTVTFNGVFDPSKYTHYRVLFTATDSSAACQFATQVVTSGTVQTSLYYGSGHYNSVSVTAITPYMIANPANYIQFSERGTGYNFPQTTSTFEFYVSPVGGARFMHQSATFINGFAGQISGSFLWNNNTTQVTGLHIYTIGGQTMTGLAQFFGYTK